MKYRFRSLLVIALILACVLSFSACGSESGGTLTTEKQNTHGDQTRPSNSTNSTVGTTQGGVVHTHQFGEWYTVTEATCTEDGLKERSCDCGEKETEGLSAKGHSMVDDVCEYCGYTESKPSEGLRFALSEDGESYCVSGIGVCTDLVVVIPSEYEGKPVTEIQSRAFYGWDVMTGVVIPSSVTKIGEKAFNGCTALEKINIPDTVTEIGEDAFSKTAYYCYSQYGYLQPGGKNWVDGSLYIGNHLIKVESSVAGAYVVREGTKTIADSAFSSCERILTVTIPDSMVSIGKDAFCGCSRLGQVTIGNGVIHINDKAFAKCESLTIVTLGNRVLHIGDYAFSNCSSLTNITIPASITDIGKSAFNNCDGLTSITFGSSDVNIGEDAFRSCDGLTSITFGTGTTYIGNSAFNSCSALTTVTFGTGATYIGSSAFNGCDALTTVTFGDALVEIGEYAFWNCSSLTEITIPESVTSIGHHAFGGCDSLASATIPFVGERADGKGNTGIEYVFGTYSGWGSSHLNEALKTIVITGGTIEAEAFSECKNLVNITIGDRVTIIGKEAFKRCSGLENVTIGNGVTSIGEEAFYGCDNLTTVTMGTGVIEILDSAFEDCDSLTSVKIPGNVKSIGKWAFKNCSNLKNVTLENGITSIGNYAFENCGMQEIVLPNTVTEIAEGMYYSCDNLRSVSIPNHIVSIGGKAFSNCDNLTTITIPESVTYIGSWAFGNCKKLVKITIPFVGERADGTGATGIRHAFNAEYGWYVHLPESLTTVVVTGGTIADNAFDDCDDLIVVTLGNGVTSIGNYAFSDCDGLTTVTIGSGVTSIGNQAFYGCDSLSEITIPGNVEYVGDSAYYECIALKSVIIQDGVKSIDNAAFHNCDNLITITIPGSVTTIGNGAFYDCDALKSVVINEGVAYIGTWAFQNCDNLTSIEISDSAMIAAWAFHNTAYYNNEDNWENGVLCIGNHLIKANDTLCGVYVPEDGIVSIANQAFQDCYQLTGVIIPASMEHIGRYIFYGCDNITSIAVAEGNRVYHSVGNCVIETLSGTLIIGLQTSVIPEDGSVTHIGDCAFGGCRNLTSITIPNGITDIGVRAFDECSSLTTITIPNSVTDIGVGAFENCSSLKNIVFDGTQEQWNEINKGTDWVPNVSDITVYFMDMEETPSVGTEPTIQIHYYRADANYGAWGFWIWQNGGGEGKLYKITGVDEFGGVAVYSLSTFGEECLTNGIGLLPRRLDSWEKDGEEDRYVIFSEWKADENNCYHIYIYEGDINLYSADMLK